jgi:hypothetical protein
MKWSANARRTLVFIKFKRISIILATKAKIFAKYVDLRLGPWVKRLLIKFNSLFKFKGGEVAKQSASSAQRERITSDRKTKTSGSDTFIGFRQFLTRLGIITAARLSETIQETTQAIKYDMEVTKKGTKEGSDLEPMEITIKRSNLNEILAQQLREEKGIDCQAPEVGSLQIEHKRHYSYNIPMSPRITTNRGCIIVKGRSFNLIQVIQRN